MDPMDPAPPPPMDPVDMAPPPEMGMAPENPEIPAVKSMEDHNEPLENPPENIMGGGVDNPVDGDANGGVGELPVNGNGDQAEPHEEKMAEPDQMETEEAPEAPEEQVQKDEEQVDEPVKEDEGEAKEETGETDEVSKEEEPPKPKDKFDAIFDSKPSEEDKPSEDKDEGDEDKEDEDKEDEDKEDKSKEDTFDKMFPEETKTEGNDSDTEPKKESTEESEDKKDSFDNMLDGKSDVDKTENDSAEPKDENETEKSEETDSKPATMIAGDLEETLNNTTEDISVTSEKIPNDEKYYAELKTEELEWLNANPVTVDSIYTKMCCSVCPKNLCPLINVNVFRHPVLGVPMCIKCRKFYGDGDWPSNEDGDEYCRVCGQGGDILLCDSCPNAFCKKCLTKMLGARALRDITKSEEWNCLVCNPEPIYPIKANYYCAYKNQEEIKERVEKDKEAAKEKEKAKRAKKNDVTAKQKADLVKSPKNFLEENISEAFKTLEVYQKSLETERTRCIKSLKDGMTVEMATSITRKLRKLYAVTQKNMDLLDRALVESFVENFPTESTRIHMGRVAPNDPPAPKARPGARNVKKSGKNLKNKVKIKPKKKKPVKKGKTIKMNGAPVYEDYVVPSLTKKKKRKAESDVECIDVSEDSDAEYYQPKKKSRPGPASSKKGKPGPASRKVGPKSKTRY